MVEGYSLDQYIVRGFNESYPIFLVAEDHKVELEIVRKYEGQHRLYQVLLKPVEPLHPGNEYRFLVENVEERVSKKLLKRRGLKGNYISNTWKVTLTEDHRPPKWKKFPELVESRHRTYGCGDAIKAIFEYSAQDDSPYLVKVQVNDLFTKNTHNYYQIPGPERISVGRGMCSGSYQFESGHWYRVRFALLDACGNSGGGYSPWITFQSPFDVSYSSY